MRLCLHALNIVHFTGYSRTSITDSGRSGEAKTMGDLKLLYLVSEIKGVGQFGYVCVFRFALLKLQSRDSVLFVSLEIL